METDLKDIAAELIYSSGGEDVEFMTIVETLTEKMEEEGVDIADAEVEALSQDILTLIHRATIRVSWAEDDSEYLFGTDDEEDEVE